MDKKNNKPQSLLSSLRQLEVGQSVTYPAARTSYLRSVCGAYGLEWGKKFKTSTNREMRTVTATRIA